MTYTPVSDASLLQAGSTVQCKFSFSYVPFTAPDEGQIRALLGDVPSLSIITLDQSQTAQFTSLGREWSMEALTTRTVTVAEIKAEIEMAIEQEWNLYSVGFMEFTRGSFSFIPSVPDVPTKTTITVVAIAIIALIGIVLVAKVKEI